MSAASGVMFTLDTESGFPTWSSSQASYGLGEMVVQGAVNPDEFYVYKPTLPGRHDAVVRQDLGSKQHQDDLQRCARANACASSTPRGTSAALLHHAMPICMALAQAGPHHRAALRPADGRRVGQGWQDRQALHRAGASGDGEEPQARRRCPRAFSS
jgi:hypothetical protein